MSQPALFVAREPDETLRTFLPVMSELLRRGRKCLVLFHHEPSRWALNRLAELGIAHQRVTLPGRTGPFSSVSELWQLWRARRLARNVIETVQPAVVVVIQDTLLLTRFLVREANRRQRGTLVVQWAFTYPQEMYDRLAAIKKGEPATPLTIDQRRPDQATWRLRSKPGWLHPLALVQQMLGLRFALVNSYGGGEARVFAVMGEAFREQFCRQGVRDKRIEVVGHPLHDLAFAQRQDLSVGRARELKEKYGLPADARVILYATQPVLWRAVMTSSQLVENVRALGRIARSLGPDWLLVVKLHPRERLDDYRPALDGDLPIRLIDSGEIAELIAPAEVFISSSSSTVLQAMMLDKPIVTVNFNEVPHFDYYENVGGTLHVRSVNEAAVALRQAIFDAPVRARLASEREEVLRRYARFDGGATSRLADLVEELAGWS